MGGRWLCRRLGESDRPRNDYCTGIRTSAPAGRVLVPVTIRGLWRRNGPKDTNVLFLANVNQRVLFGPWKLIVHCARVDNILKNKVTRMLTVALNMAQKRIYINEGWRDLTKRTGRLKRRDGTECRSRCCLPSFFSFQLCVWWGSSRTNGRGGKENKER